MRQVPTQLTDPIGIIGHGRVARHFLHYLSLLDRPVLTWSRRTSSTSPVEALAACPTVLLLISDAAIVSFVTTEWPELRRKQLVHFSGSVVTDFVEGAHPLMTFGPDLYDLPTYARIPFVLDEGRMPFEQLLPGLPNPSFTIPASDRPYYHALCVMAGNFSTLLWLKLFNELHTRFNLPPSAAHPYLSQVSANLLAHGGRALTGPLARGDRSTIDANLEALKDDPFHAVYLAFVRAHENRA